MQQEFKAEMRANKYLFMKTQIRILSFSQKKSLQEDWRMFLILEIYKDMCVSILQNLIITKERFMCVLGENTPLW